MLDFLVSQGVAQFDSRAVEVALECASKSSLEYLLLHEGCSSTEDNQQQLLASAARGGDLSLIEFVMKKEKGTKSIKAIAKAFNEALCWGKVTAASFLLKEIAALMCNELPSNLVVTYAAMSCLLRDGHLEALQFLRSHHLLLAHQLDCTFAAQGGRLDVLKWIHKYYPERLQQNAGNALEFVEGGVYTQLELKQWLEKNFPSEIELYRRTKKEKKEKERMVEKEPRKPARKHK